MERMGAGSPLSAGWEDEDGAAYAIGGLTIELRDLWLELRTRVCASEKAVSHRWGASVTGCEYVVSTTGSSTGTAFDEPAALSGAACCFLASRACCHGLLDTALCFPSLDVEFLRIEARFPPRGGVASMELAGPSWGVAVRGLL
jgi:hypothetical protein